jgi:hypothetical protein
MDRKRTDLRRRIGTEPHRTTLVGLLQCWFTSDDVDRNDLQTMRGGLLSNGSIKGASRRDRIDLRSAG